jgi:protein TonB
MSTGTDSYRARFEEEGERSPWKRTVAGAAIGVAALALLSAGVWQLVKDAGAPKRKQAQVISLVQPRELPKPPPEPEKPKEEVKEKIDTPPPPEAKTDSPPPEAPVRLEGAAGPGGDNFGIAGGGKGSEYNIAPVASGTGTGRGFSFYTSELQALLQSELNRNDKLRGSEYRAAVALWLRPDGRVEKVEITGSTGNPQTDALLRETIAEATRFKAPPESMPQPVKLRVTARGSG